MWTVTPSVGSYSNGVWTIPSLASGVDATLNITGTSVPKSTIYNTVSINGQTEYNPLIPDTRKLGVYTPAVDIEVSNLPWQYYYTTGTYEDYYDVHNNPVMLVTAYNNGPDDATNVQLEFDMGSSFQYMDLDTRGYGTAIYNPNNNTITWTPGNIPEGTAASLIVDLKVLASGDQTPNQTTTCLLTHVDQYDTNPSDGVSSYAITTDPAVDVPVNQTYQTYTNNGSNYVTYTINTANNGPDNATGVQITDLLPAGLTYVKSSPSIGTYNYKTGIWNIGNFNYNATGILNITAKITATTGTIKNYATCTNTDQFDWNWADDSQETLLTLSGTYTPKVDIEVSNLPWQYYYTTGTYEDYYDVHNNPVMLVTAYNNGPDDATNVQLEFDMGSSFQYMDLDTRGYGTAIYNPNNNTITWTPGNIPEGTAASLVVYLKVLASGDQTPNQTTTCLLTHVDQYDTNPSDGVSSYAITTDPAVDVPVNQTYQTYTNNGSNYVTYTINITNNGPDNATGVQITDLLPAGLTYVSSSPSIGTYNYKTGIWNIGNLNNNETETINITAEITATTGTIKNYATCTNTDQFDWNWADDSQETILTLGNT